MDSIIQSKKECFVCGTTYNLHSHHCIYGTSNRKQSEKYGLKVWLCQEHHTGNTGVHRNKELDMHLKKLSQAHFEKVHGNRRDFMNAFGRNYLD
jgi:hypothetical protein